MHSLWAAVLPGKTCIKCFLCLADTFFSPFYWHFEKSVALADKVLKSKWQPLPFLMSSLKPGWQVQMAAVAKGLKMF